MQYRSEIDGLRALAILPVLWLHADLPGLSGGYLGVDVFFVISGFLITGIITREMSQNQFSLVNFYERRARRILPALFLVIAVTSIALPVFSQSPKVLADYGQSIVAVVSFVSNFYFWQTSGYFGSTSELSPMLHTWSLAVEEQYYVFFPLIAMAVLPNGRRFIGTLLSIFVLSLAYAQWQKDVDPTGNFYLLPGRAWELMAGGIASVYIKSDHYQRWQRAYGARLANGGVVMVAASYILFTPETAHPSVFTLLPVAGTVLILLFAVQGTLTARLLSLPGITFVGVVSYSLYLWHQPVLAALRLINEGELTLLYSVIGIGVSFLMSVVSWRFVETPLRNRSRYTRPAIFKYTGVGLACGAVLGLLFVSNVALRSTFEPAPMARYQMLETAHDSHTSQPMAEAPCKLWSPEFDDDFETRFSECAAKYDKAVFILGGSHGMDLYNAVAYNSEYPFVVSVSRGFCRAHGYNGNPKDLPHCQYDDFLAFAKDHARKISLVIYTQTPDRLFAGNNMYEAKREDINTEYVDDVVNYLANIKQTFAIPVLMVGMLPPVTKDPVEWDYKTPFDTQLTQYISTNAIELSQYLDSEFAKRLRSKEIGYISKMDGFGLQLPRDLVIDSTITYSDRRHLSTKGEEVFGRRLLELAFTQGYTQLKPKHGNEPYTNALRPQDSSAN
ncbi:acyltransferase family protein [Salinimonas sediminis]|uniref:Acyltransferase n=1 Tax=Salinimonas sediminis TaxID=2303538 RepID=A0A346NM88_9ALTE|nr:acyltransferase family protein [Salinimonas sediminis]AXR06645.1 acyltransferase [Salinimonas sediminis]